MNSDDSLRGLLARIGNISGSFGVPVGVNEKVTSSCFPIHVAAVWGDVEAIGMLIRAGADINALGEHGYTALHEAVEQEHTAVIQLLLYHGADQSIKNDNGYTPKELAELLENQSVIEVFQKSP